MIAEHIKEHNILGTPSLKVVEDLIADMTVSLGAGNVISAATESTPGCVVVMGGADGKTITPTTTPLSSIAPKESPIFTGVPEVPTAGSGNNSLQAASTGFVQSEIAAAIPASRNLLPITLTSASKMLSAAEANYEGFILSGALTANVNLIVPNTVRGYKVINNCTGAFTVTVKTSAGTGVGFGIGMNADVYCGGTSVTLINPETNQLSLITITSGNVLETIRLAMAANSGANKLAFNASSTCTNLPTTEWMTIEANGSGTSFLLTARPYAGNAEYMHWYASSAWDTDGWTQILDADGYPISVSEIRYSAGEFTAIVDALAASMLKTYKSQRVRFTTGCTGLPSTNREWVVDVSKISSSDYIFCRAHNDQTGEIFHLVKNITWATEWKQITDRWGLTYGHGTPIDCGTTSFKEVVLANPGATRFKLNSNTPDTPLAANLIAEVIWFIPSAQAASCYFKVLVRSTGTTYMEWEITYNSGTWTEWEQTRDANGYKSMGYDDIGSTGFTGILALLPASGVSVRWINILSTSPAAPDPAANYRTMVIGSTGGCILRAFGSTTNHSEWINRYNGTTWTGWIQVLDSTGRPRQLSVVTVAASTSVKTVVLANPGVKEFAGVVNHTDSPQGTATKHWKYTCEWSAITGASTLRMTAKNPVNLETWEIYCTTGTWSTDGWIQITDASGNAVNSVGYIGSTVVQSGNVSDSSVLASVDGWLSMLVSAGESLWIGNMYITPAGGTAIGLCLPIKKGQYFRKTPTGSVAYKIYNRLA